ncbi:MAG: MBL fold metallo-hydrolase [Methanomassiliicoccales archaeon]|jgi:phosphoribosyl 1,2-cyclic phosphodiesterase
MTTLTFLGTGGGRFATIYQVRSTGGLYLKDGINVHIDPGPGAAVNMAKLKLDPAKTDVLLISHCHPDHYTDAEVLIEGMTRGGLKKRGIVAGSSSVLEGHESLGPAVSRYHKNLPLKVSVLSPGDRVDTGKMDVIATPTKHSDPTGVGFVLRTSAGDISYMSDTELEDAVVKAHEGARILILALTRPLGSRVPNHICTEDAAEISRRIKPEMTILTHFGAKLIYNGAGKQAKYIEEESGVRTLAAEDLMTVTIGRTIRVTRKGQAGYNGSSSLENTFGGSG